MSSSSLVVSLVLHLEGSQPYLLSIGEHVYKTSVASLPSMTYWVEVVCRAFCSSRCLKPNVTWTYWQLTQGLWLLLWDFEGLPGLGLPPSWTLWSDWEWVLDHKHLEWSHRWPCDASSRSVGPLVPLLQSSLSLFMIGIINLIFHPFIHSMSLGLLPNIRLSISLLSFGSHSSARSSFWHLAAQ